MEKYIILGYAILLAILFDGSTGKQSAVVAQKGNLTFDNPHPIYSDSKTDTGTDRTRLVKNVSADRHFRYR